MFEDGVKQDIIAFNTVTGDVHLDADKTRGIPTTSATTTLSATGQDTPRRTYLIVIDTLHSAFGNLDRVRDAVSKVLRNEEDSGSEYALMTLGRNLKVLQDSTRDSSLIAAAVRSRSFEKVIGDSEGANTGQEIQQFTALMRGYCLACACEINGGSDGPGCPAYKSRVQAFLLSFSERTYILDRNFLLQLNDLVKALITMPTTRTVIFVSDGFNRFPGRELYAILQGFAPKDRSFQFNPRDMQSELDAILRLATKYDVKFYTIDSRGLYMPAFNAGGTFDASTPFSTPAQMDARNPPPEAVPTMAVDLQAASAARENADALAELAHQTGGLFFENNNDLSRGLTRAFADGREYYVLAYVSKSPELDGKYRKITVELRDKDKYHITAKAGYWAATW